MSEPTRTLTAFVIGAGWSFDADPKRPKASIADELGYAASSGVRMMRDTREGTRHVGYVFGPHWVELQWVVHEPWKAVSVG